MSLFRHKTPVATGETEPVIVSSTPSMSYFFRALTLVLATIAAMAGTTMAGLSVTPAPRYAQVEAPTPPQRPATRPAPQAAAETAPPSLDRINAYFNAMKGMQADFVQVAPDGRRYTGVLYLLRPGRMRFEYNPPATIEVVADGRSVMIRDKKLKSDPDIYFIGQTPLKFLLQPKIDIAKDAKVIGLKRVGPDIQLFLEDRSTFGGTSRIRVAFDEAYSLREWVVTDPQGNDTRVTLSNLNLGAMPNRALFVIDEQKILEPKN